MELFYNGARCCSYLLYYKTLQLLPAVLVIDIVTLPSEFVDVGEKDTVVPAGLPVAVK